MQLCCCIISKFGNKLVISIVTYPAARTHLHEVYESSRRREQVGLYETCYYRDALVVAAAAAASAAVNCNTFSPCCSPLSHHRVRRRRMLEISMRAISLPSRFFLLCLTSSSLFPFIFPFHIPAPFAFLPSFPPLPFPIYSSPLTTLPHAVSFSLPSVPHKSS